MSLPEVASQSLAVLSFPAVRIRVPSALNAACRTSSEWLNEARSFPGSCIPKLGSFVRACSHDPSTIRTERCVVDLVLMVKGRNKLARGRIPELGAVIRACCQNPRTVRAKCCPSDNVLVGKGGNESTGSGIPELGVVVRACCQDTSTIRTKRRA